jgi:DNA-binding MarR family transcriptional regulator
VSYDNSRPPGLLALPSYVASKVGRIGHGLLLDALADDDLRLSHYAVLVALGDLGRLAQHELADRLEVNRSHLVGYVDHLEQRGLVQRERDADDRRRQEVALTADGRTLVERFRAVAERSQAEFLGMLSTPEREQLIALLRRVLLAHDQERLRTRLQA